MANNQDKVQSDVLSDVEKLAMESKRDQDFDSMVEAVPMDVAVVKAENDSLAMMARLHPRNESWALEAMLKELEAVSSLITGDKNEYFYRIKNRGEGLTIRAAEMIVRRWGNCTTNVRIAKVEDGAVATGVFVDLENNVQTSIPTVVSRYERRRIYDGHGEFTGKYKMKRLDPDEFAIAIGRQSSKAFRNTVFRSIPRYVTMAIIAKIKKIEGTKYKEPGAIDKMLASFLEVGITRETIEQHLGHPVKSIDEDEFVDLRAIYSGIIEGETSAKKAFALEEESPERPSGPVGEEVFTPKEEKKDSKKSADETLAEELMSQKDADKALANEATLRDVLLKIVLENKGLTVKEIVKIIKEKYDRDSIKVGAAYDILNRMVEDGDIDKTLVKSIPVYGPMQ